MSNTLITILRILLHGEIKVEELGKYISLDYNSIDRNIKLLNEYLLEKNISPIKRYNNRYFFNKSNINVSEIFPKLDILSSEERREIISIKLLLNGSINLEKERELLDISRTTILKDFKIIKSFLLTYGITTYSKNSKGIFLDSPDSEALRYLLCNKIIKLFVDRDSLTKKRKELLDSINILNETEYIKLYKYMTEKLDIPISIFAFYGIYSMALIEKFKGSSIEYTKSKSEISIENFDKIHNLIENYAPQFSNNFKEFLVTVFYKAKIYYIYDNKLKTEYEIFFNSLCNKFSLTKGQEGRLKTYLQRFFFVAGLNYRFGALWIRETPKGKNLLRLLSFIEKILEENSISLIYSDIVRLAVHLTSFLATEYLQNKINIAIIYQGINEKNIEDVSQYISNKYPNIELTIEPLLYFKIKTLIEQNKFELIISDTNIHKHTNLVKICSISISEVENTLFEHCLKKFLEPINLD